MFRDLKIKTKIFTTFFIAGLILTAIGVSIFYYFSTNFIRTEIYNSLEIVAQSRAKHIIYFIKEQKDKVLIAAIHQELSNEELKEIKDIHEEYTEVFVLDSTGKIIASSEESHIGIDRSKDDYFIQGKKGIYVKGVYFSETLNEAALAVSAPQGNGNVLVARIDINVLNEIVLDKTGIGETGETYLVNKEYYVITGLLFVKDAELKQKIDSLNSIQCFKDLEEYYVEETKEVEEHEKIVSVFEDYRGVKVLGTHSYIPEMQWCLLAEIDEQEALSPLRWMSWIIIGIVLSLFFAIYLIVNWISQKISEPIKELHHGTKIIEEGNLNYKVGTNNKDEIGQLSRSFDMMTLAIRKSRAEVDKKVKEQTKKLSSQSDKLEQQQQAILNILEDVEKEKDRAFSEKDKINAILHSIGDGVFVVDKDYKIIMINKVAIDMCGYKESDKIIGQKYSKVLNFVYEKNNKVNDKFIKDSISAGKIKEMSNNTILLRKDGRKIAVSDSAAPLKDKLGNVIGCVVVFRDVSKERKIAQMESDFVSIASHQLRTPITAIQWVTERFLKQEKLTKQGKEYLENVHVSAKRLNALVNLLLNVSQIEAGKINVFPEQIELVSFIKEIINQHIELCNKKSIKLVFKKYPKELSAITDNNILRNILESLVSNAVEYTPKKGNIDVSLEKKGKGFVIIISDTGIGILEKDKPTIFEKFTRGKNAQLIKTDGTGLGLYFAKQATEILEGKIGLKSKENKGTTFFVEFPLELKTKVKSKKFM